jgi:CDP-diacylglycerol--glycerol-3-phosphate 3-phosphatidyltransferase
MNTANKLTILRMILVPFFMAFLMIDGVWQRMAALVIFIIASVTDAVDGYIARNYNQVTTFGKFMDPIADKMLTTSAFIVLLSLGRMSPWALMLIMVREFMVSGIRLLAVAKGTVIAASMSGKIKTVSQMVAIIAAIILLNPFFEAGSAKIITEVLIWISTAATVVSGLEYVLLNRELLKG